MADSHAAGRPVEVPKGSTIADGLAVRVAIPLAVERLRAALDVMVRVSEREIASSLAACHDAGSRGHDLDLVRPRLPSLFHGARVPWRARLAHGGGVERVVTRDRRGRPPLCRLDPRRPGPPGRAALYTKAARRKAVGAERRTLSQATEDAILAAFPKGA